MEDNFQYEPVLEKVPVVAYTNQEHKENILSMLKTNDFKNLIWYLHSHFSQWGTAAILLQWAVEENALKNYHPDNFNMIFCAHSQMIGLAGQILQTL